MEWPRHQFLAQTLAFLTFCDMSWEQWPAGPYVIESRATKKILGSTGFDFKSKLKAEVGYVLAKDAWGQGYASEALTALVGLTPKTGIHSLFAYCHPQHHPSRHVLEKCGFILENTLHSHTVFPNSGSIEKTDVLLFTRSFN